MMRAGKILTLGVVISAAVAGAALYYLQVFGYYTQLSQDEISLEVTQAQDEALVPLALRNARAIDAQSSPIRFRACFETDLSLASAQERLIPYPEALPLVAPFWFGCFDADRLGEDLETGEARAYLGTQNIEYGIDQIIVLYPDGQGYAWRQLNRCGKVVFKGRPAPEGCPAPPQKSK